MEIVFTDENRIEILHLPIIPETFDVSFPHNNETITTISDGDMLVLGLPGLKTIAFNCWLPNKSYSFAKSKVMAQQGKDFFTKWKRKRRPIRIVVTSKDGWEIHNELYAIDDFTFGYDRVGDMPYSLSLTQFIPKKVMR
ncbi:uncharacterized protein containing LysM domain [Solibacillus silvestris StLB046]|uniref:Uncharacterized protein containing LysM domain n=1 Tax=Solibacillus silvestris (strain StLB046) TaxID=1002809 RepID=F2F2L8_SOLSS|nr:hypothetical protein [Solibacillus silvestris]BAK15856.1 uncharacterized protein containing LysM domain [Solibacillus silvestris StLB046]